MARRRAGEKPVERLRSSWTSDADLEETLASMFHQGTVPGDKLATIPKPAVPPKTPQDAVLRTDTPDKLTSADSANLTHPSPDSLAAVVPDILPRGPADSLSGPLYRTLDGLVVDAKCIRPFDTAQNAHSPSEHVVYTAMWRLLGSHGSELESREGLLPMRLIAAKVSLSVRNLRRVLHSLVEKLAVDVTEYEDKTKSIPRRYRVWSPKLVVERRRRAGYTHVYRSRNLITLATPHDSLSGHHEAS